MLPSCPTPGSAQRKRLFRRSQTSTAAQLRGDEAPEDETLLHPVPIPAGGPGSQENIDHYCLQKTLWVTRFGRPGCRQRRHGRICLPAAEYSFLFFPRKKQRKHPTLSERQQDGFARGLNRPEVQKADCLTRFPRVSYGFGQDDALCQLPLSCYRGWDHPSRVPPCSRAAWGRSRARKGEDASWEQLFTAEENLVCGKSLGFIPR